MSVSVVRLGTVRDPNEGLRIGTVRRPPRGVPKTEFATRDFYDVWMPILSPSPVLVSFALAVTDDRAWRVFERKYRAEMKAPQALRILELLAALSRGTHFSVGCYCEDERRCHRSVLRALLSEHGANICD
ncbi:MAG: DUF488 family protein [Gemmatimonadaceae bacterium]